MTSVRFTGVTVECEAVWADEDGVPDVCTSKLTLAGNDRPANHGWGTVRVYTGKYDLSTTMADQNGWTNHDLCPEHYVQQMCFLGIEEHNISKPCDAEEEWEPTDESDPIYDDRGTD